MTTGAWDALPPDATPWLTTKRSEAAAAGDVYSGRFVHAL